LLSRILVLLIISRRAPDLFLYVGQTHVHHLNYGIFMLVAVGAWLLFVPPAPHARGRDIAALLYGVGLALTFDEFGMWLHLGGSYWQRASYDAVVIAAALLALVAYAPALRSFRPMHLAYFIIVLVVLVAFSLLVAERVRHLTPALERLEHTGPQ
jgi:hypothetical protein